MESERHDQERKGGNDPRTNEQQKRQQENPSRGPQRFGEGGQSPGQQPPSGDPAHVSSKAIATTMGTKIRVSANQGT